MNFSTSIYLIFQYPYVQFSSMIVCNGTFKVGIFSMGISFINSEIIGIYLFKRILFLNIFHVYNGSIHKLHTDTIQQ